MKIVRLFTCLLSVGAILTALAGCAETPQRQALPETRPAEAPPTVQADPPTIKKEEAELEKEPPRPKLNLSGFPLAYRQGYHDGCASAQGVMQKDEKRFTQNADYRLGWQDGSLLCRPKE